MHSKLSFGRTPSTRDLENIDAFGAAALPRHRWYFVKEAFSPEVVERAIEDSGVGPGDIVLDPFVGSGTVPLCCSAGSLHAIGVEVNPFLAAVARAKLQRTRPQTVLHYTPLVAGGIDKGQASPFESFFDLFRGGWCLEVALQPQGSEGVRRGLAGDNRCLPTRPAISFGWALSGPRWMCATHQRTASVFAIVEIGPAWPLTTHRSRTLSKRALARSLAISKPSH